MAKTKDKKSKSKKTVSKSSNEHTPKKIKWKELTDEHKELLTLTYHDENLNHNEKIDRMVKVFGVIDRTIRKWWERLDLTTPNSKIPKQLQIARERMVDEDTDILLVTSAQNTTAINYNMFDGMKELVDRYESLGYKTQIVVIPMRYRNPTSPTEDISKKNKTQQWWVDEVDEYLYYNKINFGDVKIGADVHTTPTASEPLNGLNAIAEDRSLIIGHPRIHFNTLPRFRNDPLRAMATTGCLTVRNYSRSRAGDKSESHHSYGFCIIEKKKDGVCHIPRNVYADIDGNFTDISFKWDGKKLKKTKKAEAIILGDIHRELLKEEVYNKTAKITKKIKTKNVILHDVLDGYRFNPHERKDVYLQRQKILKGKFLIEDEINQAVDFPLECKEKLGVENVYVVESNHDVFLDRYITDMDWKKDLHNSASYLKYAHIMQTVDLRKDGGGLFGHLINERYRDNKNIIHIPYGGNLKIKNFQVGAHGDAGVNGSRGNILGFKRLNTKIISAHTHSPMIRDNASCVGLMAELHQDYTRRGLSSHAYANMFIFPNGKRQMLCFGDDLEVSFFV